MTATVKNLAFTQGSTFSLVLRWETEPIVYRPITAISQSAPVRITAPAHGLVDGWRAAVVGGKGMDELRATPNDVKDRDYHQAKVIDADTIEFNDVNAAGFKAYASGAHLQYNTPVDLAGYVARLVVKDKVGGVVLFQMVTTNGRVLLDLITHTITLTATAEDLSAQTWTKGVYELELESPGGVVTKLMRGAAAVSKEIPT